MSGKPQTADAAPGADRLASSGPQDHLARFSDEDLRAELNRRRRKTRAGSGPLSRLAPDVERLHYEDRTVTEIATWLMETKPYLLPVEPHFIWKLGDQEGQLDMMKYYVKRTLSLLGLKSNPLAAATIAARHARFSAVIRLRQEGRKFKEIGAALGVSEGRARQLYEHAERISRRGSAPARPGGADDDANGVM